MAADRGISPGSPTGKFYQGGGGHLSHPVGPQPTGEGFGGRVGLPTPGADRQAQTTAHRGRGKVFYFQPGHETFPIYDQKEVQLVLTNAVRWAAPVQVFGFRDLAKAPNVPEPMDPIPGLS